MKKHMLIASILALSGCVTPPQISESGPAATTGTPTSTGGQISDTQTPRHAEHAVDNGLKNQSKPDISGSEDATGRSHDGDTTKINAWIAEVCPRFVGPASWRRCVERERNAVNAGLPSTEGLPADIRAWIEEVCPRFVGPASWSRCVERERNAVNAGLPSTEGVPADMRAWIEEVCPRFVGPASWSRCIRRELNAVSAGLASRETSGEDAEPTPANRTGQRTVERGETPGSTQTETAETNERIAEVPSRPPKDPAPHLPKPDNGERWLCADALKTMFLPEPEPTIVLTRESPRDQARGTGKIAVGGVIHKTDFQIEGISRRWDWNDGEDAIVIGPSGQGGYYDFRLADDEGRGTASSFFKCHER